MKFVFCLQLEVDAEFYQNPTLFDSVKGVTFLFTVYLRKTQNGPFIFGCCGN